VSDWWKSFFDADYVRIWSEFVSADKTAGEVEGLWQLLALQEGSRVLDAPCGYGRLSRPLAERGCRVLGVDQSEVLLQHAESRRGELSPERLRYLRHDLRLPLPEDGFDVAINVFSSLGYGTEAEDVAILRNLRGAVRPGGLVLVETMHRDLTVLNMLRNPPSMRLPDGTLVVQEVRFDSIAGSAEPCWYWSGPNGSGSKSAAFRVYAATELVALIARAGLRFVSAHRGCSTEPFKAEPPDMGGRLAILARRD